MANMNSVGTPDVNKQVASDLSTRMKPKREQATAAPRQSTSPDRTRAGWATGANTGGRPARPDLGQTPMAPPPRPQNVNYTGPVQSGFTGGRPMAPVQQYAQPYQAPVQMPVQAQPTGPMQAPPQMGVQGGYTGGRPQMGYRAPQYAQAQPMAPQPQYGGWRQPMPQRPMQPQWNTQQAQPMRQSFANQYNPNPNWRRY